MTKEAIQWHGKSRECPGVTADITNKRSRSPRRNSHSQSRLGRLEAAPRRSLESDLAHFAENWVRLSKARRGGRTVAHLIAEVQSDPDLAVAWRERFVDRIRNARRPIIERAIARGEVPAGSDPELIMDLLFGPLYHRYLNMHLPLDQSFARSVSRMVAAGALDGAAVSDPRRTS